MDEKKKDAPEATPEPKAEAAPKKEKGNTGIFLGIIIGVLVLNSAVAFMLVKATTPKKDVDVEATHKTDSIKTVSEQTTNVGATTGDKPIEATVNIAGTDGERFLKVSVAFEFDNIAHPKLAEALTVRAPKIKDILIDHLSKLTLIEVTEPDAKNKIRKDLLRLVNSSIPPEEGEIRDVYILNYIIQ